MSQLTTVAALQSLAGDQAQAGWQTLVERHGADVWRLILSRSRDAHEAEDVYQDFWMALPRSAASFKPGGEDPERSARAWIMRVAYTTALDRLRRRRLTTVQTSQGASMESATIASVPADAHLRPGTEDLRDREILLARVQTALNELPENYRRPLLLYVVGGLSYEDLASDLACTVNNARVRVHRGLKRMREVLGGAQAEVNDRALAGLILPAMLLAPSVPSFTSAATSGIAGVNLAAHAGAASTTVSGVSTATIATVAGAAVASAGLVLVMSREPAAPVAPMSTPPPVIRTLDDFNRSETHISGHAFTRAAPELSLTPSPSGGSGNALRFGWNSTHSGWIDCEYADAK
jgi:RNA polymerase sigma-70 factor (ECF subfamily)